MSFFHESSKRQLSPYLLRDMGLDGFTTGISQLERSPKKRKKDKAERLISEENQKRLVEVFFEWIATLSEPISKIGTSSFDVFLRLTPLLRSVGLKFDWDKYLDQSNDEKTAVRNWICEEYLIPRDILLMLEDIEPTLKWMQAWIDSVSEHWASSIGQYVVNNLIGGVVTGLATADNTLLIIAFKSLEGLIVNPLLASAEGKAYNAINSYRGPSNYAKRRSLRMAYRMAGIDPGALELEIEEMAQGTIRGFEWQMNEISLKAKLIGLLIGNATAEIISDQWRGLIRVAVLAGTSWASLNLPRWLESLTATVHQMWKEPISQLRDTSATLESRERFTRESTLSDNEKRLIAKRNRGTIAAVTHDEILLGLVGTIKTLIPMIPAYFTKGNLLTPAAVTASTNSYERYRVKEENSVKYVMGKKNEAIQSLKTKLMDALTKARGLLTRSDAQKTLGNMFPELQPEEISTLIDENTETVKQMNTVGLRLKRVSVPRMITNEDGSTVESNRIVDLGEDGLVVVPGKVVGLFERNASGKTSFLNKCSGRITGNQEDDQIEILDDQDVVLIQAVEPKQRRKMMPLLSGGVDSVAFKPLVLTVLLNYSTIFNNSLPFNPLDEEGKKILFAWNEGGPAANLYTDEIAALEVVLLNYINSSMGKFWSTNQTDETIFVKDGFSGAEGAMMQFAMYFAINQPVILCLDEPEAKMSVESFLVFLDLLEVSLQRGDFSVLMAANKFTHLIRARGFFADEISFNQTSRSELGIDISVRSDAYAQVTSTIDRKRAEFDGRPTLAVDQQLVQEINVSVEENFPDSHSMFVQIMNYLDETEYEEIKPARIEAIIEEELLLLMVEDFTSAQSLNKLLFIFDLMFHLERTYEFQVLDFPPHRRLKKIINELINKFLNEYSLLFELLRTDHLHLSVSNNTVLVQLVFSLSAFCSSAGYFSRTAGPDLLDKFRVFNSKEYRALVGNQTSYDSTLRQFDISLEKLLQALLTSAETEEKMQLLFGETETPSDQRLKIYQDVSDGKISVATATQELKKIDLMIIKRLSSSSEK